MNSLLKKAFKVTAAAVTLLVVAVGAGVGYTWYMGEHGADGTQSLQQPTQATGGMQNTERPKISETATIGATVQSITSPVVPGSNSSIMVRTNPDATCSITVTYGEVQSKDSGLASKKSDEYGIVEWTWTVESSVPTGNWPVEITCANKKNTAVVENDLRVVSSLE